MAEERQEADLVEEYLEFLNQRKELPKVDDEAEDERMEID